MKKANLLSIIFLMIIIAMASGCSKEETCTWGSNLLTGKSFKITKVVLSSNGSTVDATNSYMLQNPCFNNIGNFTSSSTYTTTLASGCSMSNTTGTYITSTENGKNYLTTTETGGTVPEKVEISSYNCNSFTIIENTQSVGTVYITFTKQ